MPAKEEKKESKWIPLEEKKDDVNKTINEFVKPDLEPIVMPLEIYEEQKRYPYIVELLNIADLKDNLKEIIEGIDENIKKNIRYRRWQPTTNAYREVLNQIKSEAKISEHMSNIDIVNQIYYFLAFKDIVFNQYNI